MEGTNEGTKDLEFALEPSTSEPADAVCQVLKHWTEELWSKHHDRAPKLTPKRRKPVLARLAEGYSVDQLRRVIGAVACSQYHNGRNENGAVYIEPETIFRDAGKVDRWLAAKTPTPHRNAPQNSGVDVVAGWGREI